MGRFYANVTLIDVDLDRVRSAIDEPAFLAADDRAVVVFAKVDDEQSEGRTAQRLSADLNCVALGAMVHDDDLLAYFIYDNGRGMAEGVVPDPALYFGPEVGPPQEPVDPAEIVELLRRGDVDAVAAALTDDFVFATERHEALAAALDLPTFAAGWGYRSLSDAADEFDGAELHQVTG